MLLAATERRLGSPNVWLMHRGPAAPERVRHTLAEMIRFRALLIAAGYPDGNDAMRCAPIRPSRWRSAAPRKGADLCSQPTISRFENLPGATALKRMMAAMVEVFCDSFEQVPRRIGSTSTTPRTGSRRPAAGAVERLLGQPLLPADPYL